MNEQIDLALRYARMLWRYRWMALLLSAIASVAGWGFVIMMPNTYEVNAKVFVDTRSMLRPLLKGLAIDNTMLQDAALLMQRTLLTRPNLEEVARNTDLDLTASTPREFEALVTSLAKRIKLSGTSRDNVYQIKFEDTSAERAKKVVDELLNSFLETALGSARTDTEVTQKFLDDQLAEYERRLIEAEERLKDFKQRNVGMMPGAENGYFRRLEVARQNLKFAELERGEAVRRRDELRKQLATPKEDGGTGVNLKDPQLLAMSALTPRIDALSTQLDQLTLQFTDRHPDIVALRESLEDLETRRATELEALAKELAERSTNTSGAVTEAALNTRLAIADVEAQAAALDQRVKAYAEEVDRLEQLVDTIPEIEAELVRLNRDYDLNKTQFEELLQRRESARLSEEVDEQADELKLKVIEPPTVPLVPSGPNRVMFFGVVFAGALAAGAALAFLLSQIQPRFYSVSELKEFVNLPILGAVSYQSTTRYRTERRMELAVFLSIFVVLVGLFGGLIALELSHFNLHGKLADILGQQA